MAGIPEAGPHQAGARVDTSDPLSVLAHGQSQGVTAARPAQINDDDLLEGVIAVRAPLQGTVISVDVSDGQITYGFFRKNNFEEAGSATRS